MKIADKVTFWIIADNQIQALGLKTFIKRIYGHSVNVISESKIDSKLRSTLMTEDKMKIVFLSDNSLTRSLKNIIGVLKKIRPDFDFNTFLIEPVNIENLKRERISEINFRVMGYLPLALTFESFVMILKNFNIGQSLMKPSIGKFAV